MKQKYYKKAFSLYNQGLLIFFTAVKYSMHNGAIYLTSQIGSLFTNMAPLTVEDRCLIKCLRGEKGWDACQMMREFPLGKWKKHTLNYLVRKIDKTGSGDRASDSGRRRSARTHEKNSSRRGTHLQPKRSTDSG